MRTKETRDDFGDGLLGEKKKEKKKRRDFKLALVLMQLLFRMDYYRERERRTCVQHRKSSHPETRSPRE